MTKGRILCSNVLPEIPAATFPHFCISHRCMILITINRPFRTASICDKYQIILRQWNLLLFTLDPTLNGSCRLLLTLDHESHIGHFRSQSDLHPCMFQIF